MTIELILAAILGAIPSLLATFAVTLFTVINKHMTKKNIDKAIEHIDSARDAITSSKEYTELKQELAAAHQENVQLKRTMNKLLTKIDKINHEEE